MGRLSFFGNFAAISLVVIGMIGAANVDKQSSLTEICLVIVALGLITLLVSMVLSIIAIFKNDKRVFGIFSLITGVLLLRMFFYLVYTSLIGLAGFK